MYWKNDPWLNDRSCRICKYRQDSSGSLPINSTDPCKFIRGSFIPPPTRIDPSWSFSKFSNDDLSGSPPPPAGSYQDLFASFNQRETKILEAIDCKIRRSCFRIGAQMPADGADVAALFIGTNKFPPLRRISILTYNINHNVGYISQDRDQDRLGGTDSSVEQRPLYRRSDQW